MALALEKYQQRIASKQQLKPPSFVEFFEKTPANEYEPWGIDDWQRILCNELEQCVHGKGIRLLVHAGPQVGKSAVASERFTPYALGVNPNLRIRLATFNVTHSERFSATIIDTMKKENYKALFPNVDCHLPDRLRVSEWSTNLREKAATSQPSFIALGLNSGFAGTGVDILIIDDPYGTADDAFSENYNEKLYRWWNELAKARFNPSTNVIVFFHRWHEDDLAGKLIAEGGFKLIRFASLCDDPESDPLGRKDGESITKRIPEEFFEQLRDGKPNPETGELEGGMGEVAFESLHQGNPKPRGGILFHKEDFKTAYEYERNSDDIFVRYWDLGTDKQPKSDRTAGVLVSKTRINKIRVHDCDAFRESRHERDKRILQVAEDDVRNYCGGDKSRYFIGVEEAPSLGAEPTDSIVQMLVGWQVSTYMESKNVEFIISRDSARNKWYDAKEGSLQEEMLAFPNGRFDDRVDGISGAYTMAARIKIS